MRLQGAQWPSLLPGSVNSNGAGLLPGLGQHDPLGSCLGGLKASWLQSLGPAELPTGGVPPTGSYSDIAPSSAERASRADGLASLTTTWLLTFTEPQAGKRLTSGAFRRGLPGWATLKEARVLLSPNCDLVK